MIKIWDTYTTKDKVLAILCDVPFLSPDEKVSTVKARMPHLSYADIVGIFWHLERERFVRITENGGTITTISIHHSARSYLRTKEEMGLLGRKWDLVKVFFGYALGLFTWFLNWLLR